MPGDALPTAYKLELAIDPAAKQAPGTIEIDVALLQPTRMIWLHAAPEVAISRARVDGAEVKATRSGDFVGVPAGKRIAIDFVAPIDHERSRGIYAEQEGSDSYVYTLFEPTDARRAFPCFDEPSFKVPWTVVLRVKQDHVALGNAPVVGERALPDGTKRVELAPSKPLPSYLVAFVVGPFEVVDGGTAGRASTPIRFAVPKGRAGELAWAKQVTPRVVKALEDYFDMAYPFIKLDVAVVPRYWGTMEHPGIVAMGQPLTLIKPGQDTRSRKKWYANILAHELGHYWFGDVVTMAWWDDTWLNESLGMWLDMIITDAVEPGWRHRDSRVGYATGAMHGDETLAVQAMRQPVTTNDGIAGAFDNDITYFKGASVLRMFEAWLGVDKWRDVMREHVRAHAFGNASAEDLFDLIGKRFGAQVELALRSFIEQPGVPRVTFNVDCDTYTLELHQTRSLPPGLRDPARRLWRLPVCYRFGDAKSSQENCVLLASQTQIVKLPMCPTWFVPNQDARGYYRSSIDPRFVSPLLVTARNMNYAKRGVRPLAANQTAAEKMMIIADLRAMVDHQDLSIAQVLPLALLIVNDEDPKVAGYASLAASIRFDALDDKLYGAARAWLSSTFEQRARILGWKRRPADSDELHELRRQFLPLVARDDANLAGQAFSLVKTWLVDHKGIDDDLVDAALEVAAYRGDYHLYTQFLVAAKSAKDRTERTRILGAIGAFKAEFVPDRALALALGSDFDLRETRGIVTHMLAKRETRDTTLRFLADNIDKLLPRMRDDEATWFLTAIAGAFCDDKHITLAAELVERRAAKVDGARAPVARALEKSRQCVVSLAHMTPELRAFLSKP